MRILLLILLLLLNVCSQSFAEGIFREKFRGKLIKNINGIQETQPISNSQDVSNSFIVDGRERSYLVHLPLHYTKQKSFPLVFVLHGGGGDMECSVRMSGINDKADKENFIVIYPNGTGKLKGKLLTWNSGNCCGYAMKNNIDDVNFMRALIEKIENDYNADKKRIYFTGISNGAMMSYRIACELSDKIAAIAPVAEALNCPCNSKHPVSVIIFHGTEDQHVPYNGGAGEKSVEKRIDNSVSYAVNLWTKNNDCMPTPKREDFGNIIHDIYTGGQAGSAVELYTIKGQGHAWPGGKKGLRNGNADDPTQEISATDIMWEFFKSHPKG